MRGRGGREREKWEREGEREGSRRGQERGKGEGVGREIGGGGNDRKLKF